MTSLRNHLWLANHFSADELSDEMIKSSYDAAMRVLLDPERFPKADFETTEKLAEELLNLDPWACGYYDESKVGPNPDTL